MPDIELDYLRGRKAIVPVVAVMISAQLNQVKEYAKGISLSASNAKYIAARAGEKAMVFRPVTNAMVEMSHKTTNLVEMINKEALTFSKASITLMRAQNTLDKVRLAYRKATSERERAAIAPYERQILDNLLHINKDFFSRMRLLESHLEEIAMLMREAEVIGTISRVEATRTDEYRNDLELISSAVNIAMLEIKGKVSNCRRMLHRAVELVKKY